MTEENNANPKQAFGDKKVPLHLCPPVALMHMAVGLREGATKYGAWNFREAKVELMTYIGAIRRHCDALLEGEWIDPDDMFYPDGTEITHLNKKSHIAGILASAAIIADCDAHGTLIDNRPPSGSPDGADHYHHMMKRNQTK